MMRRLLFSVCLFAFIYTNNVESQELPNITPPTPEAAALGKYIEVPVSMYTGLPNISIPIYNIQQDGVSIPINLSYHARGIKVEETASRVGLGWTLNHGGSISMQTRGTNDRDPQYGYASNDLDATFFSSHNKRSSISATYAQNHGYDFFPDMFFFNLNGNSGKFIIDKTDNQPVLQEFQDIKIEYDIYTPSSGNQLGYGSIGSFIVTDANGIKYYFGVSKDGLRIARNIDEINTKYRITSSDVNHNLPVGYSFFSSWQLMDIETTNGDIIKFEYDDTNGNETSSYTRRSYDKLEGQSPVNYSSTITSYQYNVKSISFKNGKLVFVPQNTARQDLNGAKALDRIELYDKNDILITKHKFHYSYTTSTTTNSVLQYLLNLDPYANRRLFLDSIQQENINQNKLPPYVFEYNNEVLPSRFSNSQDLWGYYNGANNSDYLTFFTYGSEYNNRRVDTTKAEAGMLKKINYPTGGSTSYTYEHNRANKSSVLSQVALAGITNPLVAKHEGISNLEPELFVGGKYIKEFQVGPDVSNTGGKYGVWFADSSNCADDVFVPECSFAVTLNKVNPVDGTLQQGYHLFIGANRNLTLTPGTYRLTVTPQGSHDPYDENDAFIVGLNWFEQEVSDSEFIYGAGKRIKKIEFDDGNGVVKTREYEYLDHNGYGTSGKLFGLPNFYSIVEGYNNFITIQGAVGGGAMSTPQGNSIGYYNVTEYLGSKDNNIGKVEYEFTSFEDTGDYYKFPHPLPTDNEWLRGKPISTKEYENTGQVDTNGKIIYNLKKETKNEYLFGGINTPPYFAVQIFYPDHDFSNEAKTLLSEDITDTEKLYQKNRTLLRHPMVMFTGPPYTTPGSFDPNDPNSYWYKTFYHTAGTVDLLSTEETNYFDYGNLVTKKIYSYNYDNQYLVSKAISLSSDAESIITKTYYPGDVDNTNSLTAGDLEVLEKAAIDKLKADDQHQIATPIQVETYKDIDEDGVAESNELLSVQRTNYNTWGSNNLVLPNSIETLKGIYNSSANNERERITYHSYDDLGNPLEVSKTDGTHIYYIWGYNNTQPIAKIENFTSSDASTISGLITTAVNASNADNNATSEAALRSALKAIQEHSSLSNSMMVYYTYDPLIGVTSITDPKGHTIYYEYDSFNRLQYVRDADGNLLSENKYKYKNQ